MDHEAVREALELAAVEPGGLERLTAGDTPQAAAIAGHLAGCDACATEFERLGRAVPLLRDVIRTTPAPDLRERTLAFVREHGERRPAAAAVPEVRTPAESPGGPPRSPTADRRPTSWRWLAAIAAALLLGIAGTALVLDARLQTLERESADLQAVTAATIRVTTQSDARQVTLRTPSGEATGSLLFSPGTTELVVTATGLTPPPAGQEFRCWLLVDGERQDVGRMFFAGDIAFWIGDTPAVATLGDEATFGVSAVDLDAPSLDADPVIVGDL